MILHLITLSSFAGDDVQYIGGCYPFVWGFMWVIGWCCLCYWCVLYFIIFVGGVPLCWWIVGECFIISMLSVGISLLVKFKEIHNQLTVVYAIAAVVRGYKWYPLLFF